MTSDPNFQHENNPSEDDGDTSEARAQASLEEAFNTFRAGHAAQLLGRQVPEPLWVPVFLKTHGERFDAGEVFQLAPAGEAGSADSNGVRAYRLVAVRDIDEPEQDVWVIDHAWTTTRDRASAQLMEHAPLVERLHNMLASTESGDEDQEQVEEESKNAAPTSEPSEDMVQLLMEQTGAPHELALATLRDTDSDLISAVEKLTGSFDEEKESPIDAAGSELGGRTTMADIERAMAAHCQMDEVDEESLEKMRARVIANLFSDPRGIAADGLAHCYFLQLGDSSSSENASASAATPEQVWYVMDEVGSAVQIGDKADDGSERTPNARLAPLICATMGGQAFSLLWLTRPIKAGESVVVQNVSV